MLVPVARQQFLESCAAIEKNGHGRLRRDERSVPRIWLLGRGRNLPAAVATRAIRVSQGVYRRMVEAVRAQRKPCSLTTNWRSCATGRQVVPDNRHKTSHSTAQSLEIADIAVLALALRRHESRNTFATRTTRFGVAGFGFIAPGVKSSAMGSGKDGPMLKKRIGLALLFVLGLSPLRLCMVRGSSSRQNSDRPRLATTISSPTTRSCRSTGRRWPKRPTG